MQKIVISLLPKLGEEPVLKALKELGMRATNENLA
jgi:hypothetical protein